MISTRPPVVLAGAGPAGLHPHHGRRRSRPLPPSALRVHLALLSQALHHAVEPQQAVQSAHRILRLGGQILILDLLKHTFKKSKELYGDLWPGFPESDLYQWLTEAGFRKVEISIVAREEDAPHFQTILAAGVK